MSSYVANLYQLSFFGERYGMGCRITTTLPKSFLRDRETLRDTVLFPAPVLTAQTETTGRFDFNHVVFGPISRKSAPQARTIEALCMTSAYDRSLYANTTRSIFLSLISLGKSSSGRMEMPFG